MEKTPFIDIREIRKSFDGGKNMAVDCLSLAVYKGQTVGLIGADGAGKSTLLRLLAGLLLPDGGSIFIDGKETKAGRKPPVTIGYMPQKFGLYEDLTVRENLEFYAALKHVDAEFNDMLDFAGLSPFQNRSAGKLSGGMKQKLGLICALLGNPELLLLDEPSVGVDPVSRRELLKMVKESTKGQTTVIWSTAYMDEAHGFDVAAVVDLGRTVFVGRPTDLAPDSRGFEEKIIELAGGWQKKESAVAKKFVMPDNSCDYPVEALHLVKNYGSFCAVKDNNLKIRKGEIYGLLGPNGAGKSTSFKMMCGLARPTSGTARIMGIDIVKNASAARAHLGYMAQKFSLYPNLSVRQNLDFFAGAYGLGGHRAMLAVGRMIEIFGFRPCLNDNAADLPLGYKQRLSLACAVMHNPPVLFLDEPTSGVDVITRREFWNHITALAQKGVTVLITTHFMDEAEYCDRISLFFRGRTIAAGTPAELCRQTATDSLESAFAAAILAQEEQPA